MLLVAANQDASDNIVEPGGGTAMTAQDVQRWEERATLRQRRPQEECLVPKSMFHRLRCGTSGASAIAFSPVGNRVAIAGPSMSARAGGQPAAAFHHTVLCDVLVYDVTTGRFLTLAMRHHGYIHHLTWSQEVGNWRPLRRMGMSKCVHFPPKIGCPQPGAMRKIG